MSDRPEVPSEEVQKPVDEVSGVQHGGFDPSTPENVDLDELETTDTTTKSDPEAELLEKLLALKDMILNSTENVECLVFAAKLKDGKNPAVVLSGEQLDFTELSVAVAKNLRQRVMNRIGG